MGQTRYRGIIFRLILPSLAVINLSRVTWAGVSGLGELGISYRFQYLLLEFRVTLL